MIEYLHNDIPTIHQASEKGDLVSIKSYVKSGIDPFIPDINGFSPLYVAQSHDQSEIVKWFEDNYPTKFPVLCNKERLREINSMSIVDKSNLRKFLSLDAVINKRLRWCGLRNFSMDFTSSENITSFISNMFKNLIQTVSEQDNRQVIDETALSHVVFGIIEEITPVEFLEKMLEKESTLNYQQMSLCFYLIKELIKQDTDNEYILQPNFTKALNEFLEKSKRNPAFKQLQIVEKLRNFYKAKSKFTFNLFYNQEIDFFTAVHLNLQNFDYLNSNKKKRKLKESLVQDLCKMMGDLILNLSPCQFLDSQIKNSDKISPWSNLRTATNSISQMVCLDILRAKNSTQREQIYKFYQECIDYCLLPEISNSGAAYAIYMGLHSPAIERLNMEIVDSEHNDFNSPGLITKKCLATSNCLPPISLYAGFKEQVNENRIGDKLLLKGRVNFSLFMHRLYALTSPSRSFNTNLKERLEQTLNEYSDSLVYHISYDLKAPKIIELINIHSLQDIEKKLNALKELTAPLVVRNGKNRFEKGTMASSIILNYVNKNFPQELQEAENISALCNEIIKNFEASGHEKNISIEEIILPLTTWRINLPTATSHKRSDSLNVQESNYLPTFTTLTSHSKPSSLPSTLNRHKEEDDETSPIVIGRRKKKKN